MKGLVVFQKHVPSTFCELNDSIYAYKPMLSPCEGGGALFCDLCSDVFNTGRTMEVAMESITLYCYNLCRNTS